MSNLGPEIYLTTDTEIIGGGVSDLMQTVPIYLSIACCSTNVIILAFMLWVVSEKRYCRK